MRSFISATATLFTLLVAARLKGARCGDYSDYKLVVLDDECNLCLKAEGSGSDEKLELATCDQNDSLQLWNFDDLHDHLFVLKKKHDGDRYCIQYDDDYNLKLKKCREGREEQEFTYDKGYDNSISPKNSNKHNVKNDYKGVDDDDDDDDSSRGWTRKLFGFGARYEDNDDDSSWGRDADDDDSSGGGYDEDDSSGGGYDDDDSSGWRYGGGSICMAYSGYPKGGQRVLLRHCQDISEKRREWVFVDRDDYDSDDCDGSSNDDDDDSSGGDNNDDDDDSSGGYDDDDDSSGGYDDDDDSSGGYDDDDDSSGGYDDDDDDSSGGYDDDDDDSGGGYRYDYKFIVLKDDHDLCACIDEARVGERLGLCKCTKNDEDSDSKLQQWILRKTSRGQLWRPRKNSNLCACPDSHTIKLFECSDNQEALWANDEYDDGLLCQWVSGRNKCVSIDKRRRGLLGFGTRGGSYGTSSTSGGGNNNIGFGNRGSGIRGGSRYNRFGGSASAGDHLILTSSNDAYPFELVKVK